MQRYPDTTKQWNFVSDFRLDDRDGRAAAGAAWTTMPGYFKHNGYVVLGGGKSFHPDNPPDYDGARSWSDELPYYPFVEPSCPADKRMHGLYYICPDDAPLNTFIDHTVTTNSIVRALLPATVPPTARTAPPPPLPALTGAPPPRRLAWGPSGSQQRAARSSLPASARDATPCEARATNSQTPTTHRCCGLRQAAIELAASLGKPFFVLNGLRRPHIPWRMPQRFWDMYDTEAPLSPHQTIGTDVPTLGCSQCGFASPLYYDKTKYECGPQRAMPRALQRLCRRGHHASVSFIDDEIGRLLAVLDSTGLADDTAVVLFGDHGWKVA